MIQSTLGILIMRGVQIPHIRLAINLCIPWYIWPNGLGLLSVWMSCSLSIVAYLGSKKNASMLNILQGS